MESAITILNILGIRDIGIYIVAIVELLRRISTFIFNFISATGDLIINGCLLVFNTSSNALLTVISACQALSLEISTLASDVIEKLTYTVHALFAQILHVYKITSYCYQTILNSLITTSQFISFWSIYIFNIGLGLIRFIADLPENIKQCLITVGNVIWLWASLIPVSIVYVCTMSVYLVGRGFEEITSILWVILEGTGTALNSMILFWADMPLESLLGLVIGLCAIVVMVKYSYPCLKRVISAVKGVWDLVFYPIHWEEDAAAEEEAKREDLLCVICQDRVRRVVSFPCRHLCMCRECSDQLSTRAEPCPVCRQHVSRTLTVFT